MYIKRDDGPWNLTLFLIMKEKLKFCLKKKISTVTSLPRARIPQGFETTNSKSVLRSGVFCITCLYS